MDNSTLQSVLVSQLMLGKTGHDDQSIFSISGLLLSDGWILTHGSLLSPNFFEKGSHNICDFLHAVQTEFEKDIVAVPCIVTESMRFTMQYKKKDGDEITSSVKKIAEKNCSLRAIWRCPLLHRTFNSLFFSWSFEKVAKFDKSVLSIFLLLRLDGSSKLGADDVTEVKRVLNDFYWKNFDAVHYSELMRGNSLEIESVPFGNSIFLDSISRGIVSNILGEENCIVLTDANAVPGCEGAPVYLVNEKCLGHRRICGLVIAPLCWCRGEWVDYTFAANLQICLKKILRAPHKDYKLDGLTKPSRSAPKLQTDLLDKSIVAVKCGFGWGTGVVVDVPTGTILTCSHVVREALGSRIKIVLAEKQEWSRLIYKTRDGQPFDVAILRLERKQENLKALILASEQPEKGARVLTAGYSFFSSSSIAASYSRGIVSHLTPCMLQTTCCVQSGSSGGPVICCTTGCMLGLVVSNIVSTGSEKATMALYPRFNMAVPASVLRKPIFEYIRTGDVRCLESLSSSDPMVQETWNFYLTPRSKI